MKVLFLDVDGVLNSHTHRGQERPGSMMGMAQEHVDELARVVRDTRCQIVVSSTWRIGGIEPGSKFWRELSKRVGGPVILDRVIDRTKLPEVPRG